MDGSEEPEIDFKFLDDSELNELDQDELGHRSIAGSLARILTQDNSPINTVGLFGGWGSGKSSIVRFVKKLVKSEDTIFVDFNVWKYEQDSLRINFIRDLTNQLKNQRVLDRGFKLDERIISTKTNTFEGKLKLSPKGLAKFAILSATMLAVAFIMWY